MFDTIIKDPEAVGQILGAIIGVAGLVVGTFITILTSFIMRHMDIRREERKEYVNLERAKKEKTFALKQEIYSEFITELASLESFLSKKHPSQELETLEHFDNEWTKIEIRVDLVANDQVRNLKDKLSLELLNLAKSKFATNNPGKEVSLGKSYTKNRSMLLDAIREDMEIITGK